MHAHYGYRFRHAPFSLSNRCRLRWKQGIVTIPSSPATDSGWSSPIALVLVIIDVIAILYGIRQVLIELLFVLKSKIFDHQFPKPLKMTFFFLVGNLVPPIYRLPDRIVFDVRSPLLGTSRLCVLRVVS